MCSRAISPFSIPTSRVRGLLLVCLLVGTYDCLDSILAIRVGVTCHLIVV